MITAVRRAAAAVALGALVAGCTSAAGDTAPTWVPSPGFETNGEGPGVHLTPIFPVPSLSGGPSRTQSPQRGSGSPAPRSSRAAGTDPAVVAKHLTAPVGLTLLPDHSALVGERTTGRIVRVQPEPNQPVPTVRTIPVDGRGDGGLLDLALSPTYDEDNLIYAYITTPTDNRVVDFTLTGPVVPVVTGIPKGRTGNTGRLAFDADGDLLIGTGDAGKPALAADPKSLAGKVLRVSDIGAPVPGNPRGTRVWTTGHQGIDGLCLTSTGTALDVESTTGAAGELNVLSGGADYGWPSARATSRAPVAALDAPNGTPGGCAVQSGSVWITSLDGRELRAARLISTGGPIRVGPFTAALKNRYGRLRTVVAAPDGALWLTTSNRDGHGKPIADDERVIRYLPSSAGNQPNPA